MARGLGWVSVVLWNSRIRIELLAGFHPSKPSNGSGVGFLAGFHWDPAVECEYEGGA